jgi:chorismate mutase/predicted Rossmann-fold nucleotide-binding protein
MALHHLKCRHGRDAIRRRRIVAAIGSGTEADADACRQVGRLIAELGCDLLTGAGRGTMEAVARAFCERRDEVGSTGLSVGIVPGEIDAGGSYATRPGYPNPWVELAVFTHLPLSGPHGTDLRSRNHINVLSADAIVALPGGPGTRSEIDLARRYGVPLIAFGGAASADVEHASTIEHVRGYLLERLQPGSTHNPAGPGSATSPSRPLQGCQRQGDSVSPTDICHRPLSPMPARKPSDCTDLSQVRQEIDRVDTALVDLIAERFGYVERAWQLKLEAGQEASVPWRNQQVIDKVRAHAAGRNVPPALCEALWRQMIGWFIQYEEEKLRDRLESKQRG